MINTEPDLILKDHHLRLTHCRKDILLVFLKHPFAISKTWLESHLSDQYDRVTIYRTIKSFLNNGVIHKIMDDDGTMKYALCMEECRKEHHHEHVHFKCRICGKTTCLPEMEIPRLKFPFQYRVEESTMLVTGICARCINKQ